MGTKRSQYPIATAADIIDSTQVLINAVDPTTGEVTTKQMLLGDLRSTFFCETLCTSVTIPSAEVLALFTTPKEIIPAQGLGTIIQPISVIGKMSGNTVPYATNVTFNVYVNGTTQACYSSAVYINTVLASPSYHQFEMIQPTIVSNSNIAENQPVEATVAVGDPTAGDGDLEIFILYRVINV